MAHEIRQCRICGNTNLIPLLDLGAQALTSIFPSTSSEDVPVIPLKLVKCQAAGSNQACGLVQLKHDCDAKRIYSNSYGYRSGLNQTMVRHLQEIVGSITKMVSFNEGDLIMDIGSNDGTLLNAYPDGSFTMIGVDPTAEKYRSFYSEQVKLIDEFFDVTKVRQVAGDKKVKVITSIAMFYDLKQPMNFMRQIEELLANDGIWVMEQSYMPTMLRMNAYDTVCHEHLEYYRLKQIKWMADRVGLKIIDVQFNMTNGGSFQVVLCKAGALYPEQTERVQQILAEEKAMGLDTLEPYREFAVSVERHRQELVTYIRQIKKFGQTIFGCGASTKGNVLLQYCGLTRKEIPFIVEVNQDKFGCFTPGTKIPIISETKLKEHNPDFLFVLPWHFKAAFISREMNYIQQGGSLIFPLPKIDCVGNETVDRLNRSEMLQI